MLNSGAALVAGDMVATLSEGIEMAKGSIHDGKATEKLEAMIALTQELAGTAE